jgi:rRNA maturation endonuclease Nob1
MSITLIVSIAAIVVAAAALINQFRPRHETPARSTEPVAPPPAPQSAASVVQSESQTPTAAPETAAHKLPQILVDTSAIIDGRIADIAAAGFIPGRLVVPRFVLAELQNIADSDDAMRRGRGRRGLDVLNALREMPDVEVEIIDEDVAKIREVDAKLVVLAQKFSCNVLTTDYNLNRVAQIQGVRVLNVNELSNAIRPVVLPGEELLVRVVQPGKERHQGVGYLADGTMIVVENGDKMIGQEVATEVTRVFQTVAGKMIFAVPRNITTSPAVSGTPDAAENPQRAYQAQSDSPHAAGPTEPVYKPPLKPAPQSATSNQGQPNNSNNNRPARPANRRSGSQTDIEDRLIAATNGSPTTNEANPNRTSNHNRHSSQHDFQRSHRPTTRPTTD